MILHIPHSSTNTLGREINKTDINHLTDFYTDELFSHTNSDRVVFDVSRFVVDVERFPDDKEPLFKSGHGICYTKGTRNNDIKVFDKKRLIETLYKAHHEKLNKIVAKTLCFLPAVVVVDCHSFPSENNSPDFCIGFNEDISDEFLNEVYKMKKILTDLKFSVSLNTPYAGAITPTHFVNDDRVECIMIEVNKDLYMMKNEISINKNRNFTKIQNIINRLLEVISDFEIAKDNLTG